MNDNLTELIEEASKLCHDCGYLDQGIWFDQRIAELRDPQMRPDALHAIDRSLTGMGSFSDISLVPPSNYSMTRHALRQRQWDLVELISAAITRHAEQVMDVNRP